MPNLPAPLQEQDACMLQKLHPDVHHLTANRALLPSNHLNITFYSHNPWIQRPLQS
jgi:hypothetical protein